MKIRDRRILAAITQEHSGGERGGRKTLERHRDSEGVFPERGNLKEQGGFIESWKEAPSRL